MMVSLAIHALLIVVAFSFVAVTVITKEEPAFEAKRVKRPRMPPKKIQVPVKMERKPKPKLRKRLVVDTYNRKVPDIKMPEITGVKGGMGGMGAGDGMGSLGFDFDPPEFKLFGTKASGGNIFIILDASAYMMVDELGGIPAYTIIKSELVRILETLDNTVVFNIAVYGGGTYTRFPTMVPASSDNVAKVAEWLKPLNAVKSNMGDKDYGPRTLGAGGRSVSGKLHVEPLKSPVGDWARPALFAMQQQADVVFILTCRWGQYLYKVGNAKEWSESKRKKWEESVVKAKEMFAKENEQRRKDGQPPRVIPNGNYGLVHAYIPGTPYPPQPSYGSYGPKELVEAIDNARKVQGADLTKKDRYSINVIHFVRANARSSGDKEKFKQLTSPTKGQYRAIEGLEAINSYVK